MRRVRVTFLTCVLLALTATAASAAPRSAAQGKACLRSHGFKVVNRPDLGTASMAASEWFVATRGAVAIDIEYFPSVLGATYARAIVAGLAKAVDAVGTAPRQNGRVVYWWKASPARYGSVVQACLGG